ncbi:GNAT family N-acetyltransferase [Cohaesibacter celericrescens]|uniref:GNAT family N-acetyltransferase n=1 Tax=Cohaesibacter celericrescens TaxID=2067669 RepID=A0A2N5XR70_9HYPH|nr:GNAT family N-acetyltransferase [Cohaesibacter celericrescens]PLW76994.1 GNAT family N-acetyltransferase [Cohaesibacter celericrescens]
MPDIPSIKTERLLLRPMNMADWPRYAALMQSTRSVYMGGPHSPKDAWGLFCSDVAQWALMGHGALMLENQRSGQCIGQVGINHGPLFPEHELGWFVYPEAEGRGYAFEAACAFRAWAYETLGIESLVSYMDAENHRSRRLAERMGAVLDSTAPRPDPDDLVFRHPHAER